MAEDRVLIRRTLNGDSRAFDELVRRYQDGLFRHLLRLTGRPEVAEDLCQESFVAFYGALRRFDSARPVTPFLFTIATNCWRMQARKVCHEEQTLGDTEPMSNGSVAEQAMAHLEYERICAAVAQLQPEQREVISLYYDQGLSYREIAGITRAPVGTVSTRLRRALDALRRSLLPEGAGLVIAASGPAQLSMNLTSALQGQASAPASLCPAVTSSITDITPLSFGIVYKVGSLWKEAVFMAKVKAVHVVIGLVVVGGATFGTVKLLNSGNADLSPLPQAERAQMDTGGSTWGMWSDRLREVYNGLPASAKQQMLRDGRYSFHIADLPGPQAKVMLEFFQQKVLHDAGDVTGSDPANVTFAFGRTEAFHNQNNVVISVWRSDQPGREWIGTRLAHWPRG